MTSCQENVALSYIQLFNHVGLKEEEKEEKKKEEPVAFDFQSSEGKCEMIPVAFAAQVSNVPGGGSNQQDQVE